MAAVSYVITRGFGNLASISPGAKFIPTRGYLAVTASTAPYAGGRFIIKLAPKRWG